MVASTTGRLFSPSTTMPKSICPRSIMLPTRSMPLRKPRQALPTSKGRQASPSPRFPCTKQAVEGSTKSRQTEVLTSTPRRSRSMPARVSALSAARVAASEGSTPWGHMPRA